MYSFVSHIHIYINALLHRMFIFTCVSWDDLNVVLCCNMVQSAQIRQRFLSPIEPLSLTIMSANWDHCSSSSTSSSSFSRDCGSHGDSNTLRKKWLDLWAVAGEVGSLPGEKRFLHYFVIINNFIESHTTYYSLSFFLLFIFCNRCKS